MGYIVQVFSPFYRKWVAELNGHVDKYLKDYTFNHSNPPSVRSSETFSFLFDSDVPDALPGFELSPAQLQLMADVWPAGEDIANAVRGHMPILIYTHGRIDTSSLSVH